MNYHDQQRASRLATVADSLKELTYREMSYLASCINNEILTYDGEDYSMANVLCAVADMILDELKGKDE